MEAKTILLVMTSAVVLFCVLRRARR